MPRGCAILLLAAFAAVTPFADAQQRGNEPRAATAEVLAGLQAFYRQTARPDGSFRNGIDPEYRGISDAAYSDLAAVTYAVTLHKTFGWKLPFETRTAEFLLGRQKPNGDFFNVAGTVLPDSPDGRVYNTTQGIVALHALGLRPRHDPLPVFEAILKEDYKQLPAYSTSFFPLAYLCAGKAIPEKADRGIRALMVQDETGYTNDHVAATFHASHYYRLIEEETPRAPRKWSLAYPARSEARRASWLLNMPVTRRSACDLRRRLHAPARGERDTLECRGAIARAAKWVLSCRNADGGFGPYPGSTSDADANYFQVGTLVMAGFLKPASPLPPDPHLLSWGHLMPVALQMGPRAGALDRRPRLGRRRRVQSERRSAGHRQRRRPHRRSGNGPEARQAAGPRRRRRLGRIPSGRQARRHRQLRSRGRPLGRRDRQARASPRRPSRRRHGGRVQSRWSGAGHRER